MKLQLLGPMALARDGQAVALPASKKTRALLGYLAAAGRSARRDRLCALFWDVPDDPRGALRWSLSKLRPLVDDEAGCRLIADRDTVALDCARMDVDWVRLRAVGSADVRKLDTPVLVAAAALQGEFMEGLDLPRCDTFQAWLVAMREDVRRWQLAILRELVSRPLDADDALELARRWAVLDPYDALARTALIGLLEKTGRRNEAEQQRALGIARLREADLPIPAALRGSGGAAEEQAVALPPQQIRFCTASDGTGLAYSVVGEGPPLVKTANWLNHLDHDWNSPVWRHWIRHFVAYRRLIRYDERGNGLSDWNAPDISFEAFVDDLESVVDAAGLERFDLLGISQGCSVAIAYAVRHPERVRKLVLYGGYAAGWRKRASAEEIEKREAMLTLTRQGWGQNNPAFRQMFTTLFFPDASAAEAEWFNELQRLSTSADNAVRLQLAFADIDVRNLLSQVTVPTLVLHARHDAVIPFMSGRSLAAGIAGAEFVQLESNNHLILEQEPAWPRAMEVIRGFLGE
ncbi:pimeloyl-ACP methyl ester carboxylesterase/DNA-binding SARP family transcriptional activator [Sphingomonas zeicaulis]|uniref:alpha/beta fold hydrolase n=1 Tax=Sphingomonas zeicaulis TaxID=1632740 RepID=UPI003D22392B